MQDLIVYIIVGVCVIWAAIMIYRRFKATPDGKCSGCPLYTACQACAEEAECPGCSGETGRTFRTTNITRSVDATPGPIGPDTRFLSLCSRSLPDA